MHTTEQINTEHRSTTNVLTPKAFHAAIGEVIGINRVYELLRGNRIRHVRIGSRYLILRTEVIDFFHREAGMGSC